MCRTGHMTLDHLAADGACLLRGQVAVVALLEVNADLGSGFHLEALEGVLCLGNGNTVLRHGSSPFLFTGGTAACHPESLLRKPFSAAIPRQEKS